MSLDTPATPHTDLGSDTADANSSAPHPPGLAPADLRSDNVSRVYADALLQMGVEAGKLDALADEADQLVDLLAAQPDLRRLLTSPLLGIDERRETIERVFEGRVDETLYRFLQVVNAKGRGDAIGRILHSFQQQVAEHRGIVEVDAHVAHRLSPAQAAEVAQRLGRALDREVVLHQYVDPSLIGGLKLRVGDQLLDASVATQLRLLRASLADTGREAGRAAVRKAGSSASAASPAS